MHIKEDNNRDITRIHANLKFKKSITIKPSIEIKFWLYHYRCYNKIFKTRPHLAMFARCYLKRI